MAEAALISGDERYPILISVLSPIPNLKNTVLCRGLVIYFQSKGESGGGQCDVTATENPQLYRAVFINKEDKENVLKRKEHTFHFKGSELRLSVQEDGRQEINSSSSQKSEENMEAKAYSKMGYEPLGEREIFPKAIAFLDPAFSELLKKKNFPSVEVRESPKGELEITGSFSAIQQVHDYMKEQIMGHKDTNSLPYNAENQPPAQGEDTACMSPALYQYFRAIFPDVVDKIKGQYKVEMRDHCTTPENTVIHFFSTSPDSSIEKAKQCFIEAIQRITTDWSQITVELEKNMSASDIERRVRENCSKTQTILDGDKITLRGPKRELSEAKRLLDSPAPQRFVQISSHNMIRDLRLDGSHWDLLKELKYNQIKEIEDKYNVMITEKRNNGDKHVQITFTTTNGPPDLSPHACQIFLTLLHKTFSNIIQREIKMKPGFQETKLSSLQTEMRNNHIEIVTNWHNGSLTLIGSLGNIHTAEKILHKWQNGGATGAEGGEDEAMDTSDSPSTEIRKKQEEDKCPVCLCEPHPKLVLKKCKHVICAGCWEQAMKHKPVCPVCNVIYGVVIGNQPEGRMSHSAANFKLPGHNCGTITLNYNFPNGVQGENHPNPGKPYSGTYRTAYLPDSKEGREVLQLLEKAFKQKLVFTIGESRTTGAENTVTWNDIHHKTNTVGGPQEFGYPDPDYLKRIREELKAKGIE
ncbi:E3 ubiquitin-protein ligase DTX3L [Xenopus laevis]|uniref:E3 ubiquitin-protein ligase n=2 Tax=Xenopus laevis TaxID=8355 RepID=A0A1L8EV76_XENLA|nr:E3 ubiquitin-protein ligase DTX3L [Xenopus laevis]OCT63238.1 hypothetical protein XELAEV_18044336mg [Xenopus laevis]